MSCEHCDGEKAIMYRDDDMVAVGLEKSPTVEMWAVTARVFDRTTRSWQIKAIAHVRFCPFCGRDLSEVAE